MGTTISLAAFPNLNIVDERMKAKQRQVTERVRVSRAFSRKNDSLYATKQILGLSVKEIR